MNAHKMMVGAVVLVVVAWGSTAWGSTLTLSLVNPGSSAVYSGTAVPLEIRGTFDRRLSAVSYLLSATGDVTLTLTARSWAPTGPEGLTYVSLTSQDPFASNLPHVLTAASLREAGYDTTFDVPGGASDGVPPGSNVLLETIWVKPVGTGSVTITASEVSGAHTEGPPAGTIFEIISIGNGSVQLTVTRRPGDSDGDGDIDLTDFASFVGCLTGPGGGPIGSGCDSFDFDTDNDVDTEDFGTFQMVFTGP